MHKSSAAEPPRCCPRASSAKPQASNGNGGNSTLGPWPQTPSEQLRRAMRWLSDTRCGHPEPAMTSDVYALFEPLRPVGLFASLSDSQALLHADAQRSQARADLKPTLGCRSRVVDMRISLRTGKTGAICESTSSVPVADFCRLLLAFRKAPVLIFLGTEQTGV